PALTPVRDFLTRATDVAGPRGTTLTLPIGGGPRGLRGRGSRGVPRPGERAGWGAAPEETTPPVKAERAAAWREAAQRMAHEIKNPLTPIRLAAERMRRRARTAAEAAGSEPAELAGVVEEGASTIVEEVTTLSALVDAFGRFARLPA